MSNCLCLSDIRTRIAEIRQREQAATPPPWQHTHKDCKYYMQSCFVDRPGDDQGVGLVTADINQPNADLYATEEDMTFIATARQDVPWLLDMLTAALDWIEAAEVSRANRKIGE